MKQNPLWHERVQATLYEHPGTAILRPVDFCDQVRRRSSQLKAAFGIGSGDAVLLLKNNSLDFLIDLFAIWHAGACAIPFPNYSSLHEITVVSQFTKCSLIIHENNLTTHTPQSADPEYFDLALVLFTSGTTGQPKGVKISHRALLTKLQVLSRHIDLNDLDSAFCALPCFFGHGLICNTLFPMMHGSHFTIVSGFDISFVSALDSFVTERKITFFSTVPSVWSLLLNLCSDLSNSSVRRIHCASSPLHAARIHEMLKWSAGIRLYDVYGITEMLGWIGCREITTDDQALFFPTFWETQRVIKNEELLVHSAFMFSGYLKRNDLTMAAHEESYFKTGDLFDNNFLKGRLKEMVIKNGIKIYFNEVEELLLSSNLISDVCAFSIPDEFSGERLGVCLVPKSGCSLEDIQHFMASALSAPKQPDKYFIMDKIERTSRGKLNRENLARLVNSES